MIFTDSQAHENKSICENLNMTKENYKDIFEGLDIVEEGPFLLAKEKGSPAKEELFELEENDICVGMLFEATEGGTFEIVKIKQDGTGKKNCVTFIMLEIDSHYIAECSIGMLNKFKYLGRDKTQADGFYTDNLPERGCVKYIGELGNGFRKGQLIPYHGIIGDYIVVQDKFHWVSIQYKNEFLLYNPTTQKWEPFKA